MNVITKLTKRSLSLNKKRTIGSIIGIVLSVALICAVSGMFTSFQETLIQNAINERGYFHIAISTIDNEKMKDFELNKDIKDSHKLYELGQSEYINSNDNEPYVTVYSTDKDDFQDLSYTLVEGEFPTNSNEIVISQKMALHANLKVGDTLELNVGQRKTIDNYELNETNPYFGEEEYIANVKEKNYMIVGIAYREWNYDAIYGITVDETSDRIHAYFSLKNPKEYKQSFVEMLGANSYDEINYGVIDDLDYTFSINHELLRWEVFAFSDSTVAMFSSLVAIVILIIIIVSVFCISNSFAISTTEKMKMYGMLASVGATKKQIKCSVLLEGFILGLIGIPLGIVCGIVAVFCLCHLVTYLAGDYLLTNIDGIVFKVTLLPIVVSIVLGLVTIYFSCISSARRASHISPIDNLRSTKDIKIMPKQLKTPSFIHSIFKTGGVLAYKNLKRSKKKYQTTVISLTISIFAFITMSSFMSEGMRQAGLYYKDRPYNIVLHGMDELEYSENDIKLIQNMDNINNSYILYDNRDAMIVLDESKIKNVPEAGYNEEYVCVYVMTMDDNSYREYIESLGLEYGETKNKGILIDDFRYYSETEQKEKITRRYTYEEADMMNLEYKKNGEYNQLSIELAHVTDLRPVGLENFYFNGGYLIVNKDEFSNLDFYPMRMMIDTSNSEELVNQISVFDRELVITDYNKQAESERAMLRVVSIFVYGFITVITLIGVTNIFNTITSNMELRQKEFAMLKSVGMTKKEFNRMINLETLFYSTKSLIYGSILGLIGSYVIYLSYSNKIELPYEFPLMSILICIVSVFVLVYFIMRYSISKINKQNTIDTIRKDNI